MMRHSQPVRHFRSFLNQRCFCRCLRAGLLVSWLGIDTRLTPICSALDSLAAEKNPGSAATCSGARPNCSTCCSRHPSNKGGVGRPLFAHLVMRNVLVLRLLNQYQFAKLIGLIRLALADHFGVRLKYAEQLDR